MIENLKTAVVIAPHPDDETLGAGGTIARLSSAGVRVCVLIVSGHLPPLYPTETFHRTQLETYEAMNILNVTDVEFLKIPATFVSQEPVSKLNRSISDFVNKFEPDLVMIPFPDRHIDHRVIFDSSMVACRPVKQNYPKIVLAYETLSETHWNAPGIEPNFSPEFFINIDNFISKKEKALNCYISQISGSHARSVKAARSLSHFRGSQNGCEFAEAFKVIRVLV